MSEECSFEEMQGFNYTQRRSTDTKSVARYPTVLLKNKRLEKITEIYSKMDSKILNVSRPDTKGKDIKRTAVSTASMDISSSELIDPQLPIKLGSMDRYIPEYFESDTHKKFNLKSGVSESQYQALVKLYCMDTSALTAANEFVPLQSSTIPLGSGQAYIPNSASLGPSQILDVSPGLVPGPFSGEISGGMSDGSLNTAEMDNPSTSHTVNHYPGFLAKKKTAELKAKLMEGLKKDVVSPWNNGVQEQKLIKSQKLIEFGASGASETSGTSGTFGSANSLETYESFFSPEQFLFSARSGPLGSQAGNASSDQYESYLENNTNNKTNIRGDGIEKDCVVDSPGLGSGALSIHTSSYITDVKRHRLRKNSKSLQYQFEALSGLICESPGTSESPEFFVSFGMAAASLLSSGSLVALPRGSPLVISPEAKNNDSGKIEDYRFKMKSFKQKGEERQRSYHTTKTTHITEYPAQCNPSELSNDSSQMYAVANMGEYTYNTGSLSDYNEALMERSFQFQPDAHGTSPSTSPWSWSSANINIIDTYISQPHAVSLSPVVALGGDNNSARSQFSGLSFGSPFPVNSMIDRKDDTINTTPLMDDDVQGIEEERCSY